MDRFGASRCLSLLARVRAASLPPDARAEYFSLKGVALQQTGRYAAAIGAFEKAARRFDANRNDYDFQHTCLTLGDLERQREQYREAARWYDRALRRAVRCQSRSADAVIVARDGAIGKALCSRGLGRYTAAEERLRDLVVAYRRAKDREGEAYALWALGTTQRFRGRLVESEKSLRRSVTLYRRQRDASGLAYALCGLGGALRMRGHALESGRLYAAAERTFRRHGDDFGRAYALCGQANSARMTNALEKARAGFTRAAAIYGRLGQKGPLGFVMWSTAQTHLAAQRPAAAARALSKSETLFAQVSDRRGRVYIHLGWGDWHRLHGNDAKATAFYRQALRGAKRLGLLLETVHAARRLSTADPWPLYARCGVAVPRFRRYAFLP